MDQHSYSKVGADGHPNANGEANQYGDPLGACAASRHAGVDLDCRGHLDVAAADAHAAH